MLKTQKITKNLEFNTGNWKILQNIDFSSLEAKNPLLNQKK